MIEKITDYTNKSFKNYTTPNTLKFKRLNIIFGYNGAGKALFYMPSVKNFLKIVLRKKIIFAFLIENI